MPYDGSSNYTLPANTAAVSGAAIQSTKFNSLTQDLEAAINDLRYQNLNIIANLQTFLGSADLATARTNLGLGTGNSPQFTGIELGHASDTTLSRSAAGVLAVEGGAGSAYVAAIELGNASDTTVTRSAAGVLAVEGVTVPLNSITNVHTAQQIELGHATDTTLTRSSAGVLAVEGVTVPLNSTTNTHTAQQIELGHATDTTLSRSAAGVMAVEGNVVPSPASQAQYDMLVRGASSWDRLAIGTAGQLLVVRSGTPTWSNASTFATAQATTSGTAIDFTSIPSWVREIDVIFNDVSTNSNSQYIVQIGDSGGIEDTGYLSAAGGMLNGTGYATSTATSGFLVRADNAAYAVKGIMHIKNISGNIWIASHAMANNSDSLILTGAGSKTLTATLDRLRLTTAAGTATFDAGSINICYR